MCTIPEIQIGIPSFVRAINFHTAENQYPAVCKTATVMPNRSLSGIPLISLNKCLFGGWPTDYTYVQSLP